MESTTIILTLLLSALTANTISAEIIEISTSSTLTPSTFNPNAEKLPAAKEQPNNFLNSVKEFLSDGKNNETSESEDQKIQGYIAHPMIPVYPAYNSGGYFYPGVNPNDVAQINKDVENRNYLSSVLSALQAALQAGLKLFAKLGLYVMGGAALLTIGGIFTTLVCHVTPLCTITFNGYDFKALNKESVKSLMTPEKIASAAALVQDAIGKYQRLQRAVGQ